MRTVIDSCIWIAYKSKRDKDHGKAVQIIEQFLNDKLTRVCITDYVIVEVTNFLLRKVNPEMALNTLDLFRKHERIEIVIVDEVLLERSYKLAKKLRISLTDASLIAMMENLEINIIHSFDSGFDRVKWIGRVENA